MNQSNRILPESDDVSLNETHKRYLGASLLTLEKTLRQVLFLLRDNEQNNIFYKREKDIPKETSTVLEQLIFSMLEKVRAIKEKYDLPLLEERQSHLVKSQLSLCWTVLLDLRPKLLSGYGNLSDVLVRELETETYSLSQTITGLISLVNGSNHLSSNQG